MTSPINREIALGIWIGCVALLWTCVIGVLLWIDISNARQQALGEVRAVARGRFESYLIHMQPAYMTASFHESGREQEHITSLKPRRAENAPDAWESLALRAFVAGAGEHSSIQTVHGESVLRYMAPVKIQNGCLQCHRDQSYSLGDVAGGISMNVPVTSTFVSLGNLEWAAGVRFGVVWIMGLCGLGFVARSTRHRLAQARQAEASIIASELRYRRLFESAREGILILDADTGAVVDVNPFLVELLGFSREAILGTKMWDLGFIKDIIANQDSFAELKREEHVRYDNKPLETRDGRRLDVEFSSNVYLVNGRKVIQCDVRDITERKRAEEEKTRLEVQLRQAQKMESVGRLAGGVAHDFNNMLGVILGHAELALGQVDAASPLHGDLQEIRKAAMRSADLTRQLLAFARKQTIAPKVLDLNITVGGMLKLLHRLIGENIVLTWQPGADLWAVKVDPAQIDSILANLCVNARDAIAGVGKLIIGTGNSILDQDYCAAHAGCAPGEYVRLVVRDDGCGMDKNTLSHLFEPFFTTKAVGEGTGLGLATVYGIVKQNKGFINVCSESNLGTTFTVYLPRHVGGTLHARAESAASPAVRGHETILLVEDESSVLKLTTRLLEQHGYTVLAASTPRQAIALAGTHAGKIDLLMTDVVMPEMNGRALAKDLLALHPGLKRLFMSGYTADVIAHQGVLDEGVHFLQKPFSTADLATEVRNALDAPS